MAAAAMLSLPALVQAPRVARRRASGAAAKTPAARPRRPAPVHAAANNNSGFGKAASAKADTGPPALDESAGPVSEFFVFVRSAKPPTPGRWLPLGELAVTEGADVASAVQERRKTLREYAAKAHLSLLLGRDVSKDAIEYGYRLQKGMPAEGAELTGVTVVPAKKEAVSVPAKLTLVGTGGGNSNWNGFAGALQGKSFPGPPGGGGGPAFSGGGGAGGGPAVGSVPLRIGPSGGS